jgi:hypothetical protein
MTGRTLMASAKAATATLTFSGALLMTQLAAATTPQQLVLDHLNANFGVLPDSVQALAIKARDLPEGALEFYVEAKGSSGHDNYNYVVIGERVYCSRSEGEFARILKEQRLLDRKDLGAAQMMRLYSLFAMPRQIKYIDQNALDRNPQDFSAYPQVKAPALTSGDQGAVVLTFYATPLRAVQPSRWTVSISRTYQVEVSSALLAAR